MNRILKTLIHWRVDLWYRQGGIDPDWMVKCQQIRDMHINLSCGHE